MLSGLLTALDRNAAARKTFDALPPSCKREYVEWIFEAKREETRATRLATTLEWLAQGKRRNWEVRGEAVTRDRGRMPLHMKMLQGGITGAGGGLLAGSLFPESPALDTFVRVVTQPAGQIFLRLLFMLVSSRVGAAVVDGWSQIGFGDVDYEFPVFCR